MQAIFQISATIIFLSIFFLAVTECDISLKSIVSLLHSFLVIAFCLAVLAGTLFLAVGA